MNSNRNKVRPLGAETLETQFSSHSRMGFIRRNNTMGSNLMVRGGGPSSISGHRHLLSNGESVEPLSVRSRNGALVSGIDQGVDTLHGVLYTNTGLLNNGQGRSLKRATTDTTAAISRKQKYNEIQKKMINDKDIQEKQGFLNHEKIPRTVSNPLGERFQRKVIGVQKSRDILKILQDGVFQKDEDKLTLPKILKLDEQQDLCESLQEDDESPLNSNQDYSVSLRNFSRRQSKRQQAKEKEKEKEIEQFSQMRQSQNINNSRVNLSINISVIKTGNQSEIQSKQKPVNGREDKQQQQYLLSPRSKKKRFHADQDAAKNDGQLLSANQQHKIYKKSSVHLGTHRNKNKAQEVSPLLPTKLKQSGVGGLGPPGGNLFQRTLKAFARSKSFAPHKRNQNTMSIQANREMTIQELKNILIEKNKNYKKQNPLESKPITQRKISLRRRLSQKINQNNNDDNISSGDCLESQELFQIMDDAEREEHIQMLWKKAYIKARAGSDVLRFFTDLSRKIYLFGVSKGLEEIEKREKPSPYILLPGSRFKNFWNIVNVILLIYTATYMPYRISFIDDGDEYQQALDWTVDMLFTFDIIITFFSAFEENDGSLIHEPKLIAKKYLKTWFFLDFLACFPFQIFENIGDGGGSSNYQKLLRLLRLPRLYRFLKVMKLLKQFKILQDSKRFQRFNNMLKMNAAIVRMIQGMVSALVITHIFACFFFLTSKIDEFSPSTWVWRKGLLDTKPEIQYLYALYWSSQTVITVGYGDIGSFTALEMLLSLFWMLFGVGFYSFIIGNYSSIISSNFQIQASIQMKIKSLAELAKKANIPFELSKKIKKFIENNYEAIYNQDDEAQLIKMLPPSLRDEVFSNTFGEVIEKVIFFNDMQDPDFLWKILPLLRPVKLEKNDILYWRGDHAEDVFFILKGIIKLYTDKGYPFIKYKEGEMFGDSDTLLNLPRDGKAIATTHLKLMLLKIELLFEKSFENQEKNLFEMIFTARRKRDLHLKLISAANRKARRDKMKKRALKKIMKDKALAMMGDIGLSEGLDEEQRKVAARPNFFGSIKNKIQTFYKHKVNEESLKIDSNREQEIKIETKTTFFEMMKQKSSFMGQPNTNAPFASLQPSLTLNPQNLLSPRKRTEKIHLDDQIRSNSTKSVTRQQYFKTFKREDSENIVISNQNQVEEVKEGKLQHFKTLSPLQLLRNQQKKQSNSQVDNWIPQISLFDKPQESDQLLVPQVASRTTKMSVSRSGSNTHKASSPTNKPQFTLQKPISPQNRPQRRLQDIGKNLQINTNLSRNNQFDNFFTLEAQVADEQKLIENSLKPIPELQSTQQKAIVPKLQLYVPPVIIPQSKRLSIMDRVLQSAFKKEPLEEIYLKFPFLSQMTSDEIINRDTTMKPKHFKPIKSQRSGITCRILSRKGSEVTLGRKGEQQSNRAYQVINFGNVIEPRTPQLKINTPLSARQTSSFAKDVDFNKKMNQNQSMNIGESRSPRVYKKSHFSKLYSGRIDPNKSIADGERGDDSFESVRLETGESKLPDLNINDSSFENTSQPQLFMDQSIEKKKKPIIPDIKINNDQKNLGMLDSLQNIPASRMLSPTYIPAFRHQSPKNNNFLFPTLQYFSTSNLLPKLNGQINNNNGNQVNDKKDIEMNIQENTSQSLNKNLNISGFSSVQKIATDTKEEQLQKSKAEKSDTTLKSEDTSQNKSVIKFNESSDNITSERKSERTSREYRRQKRRKTEHRKVKVGQLASIKRQRTGSVNVVVSRPSFQVLSKLQQESDKNSDQSINRFISAVALQRIVSDSQKKQFFDRVNLSNQTQNPYSTAIGPLNPIDQTHIYGQTLLPIKDDEDSLNSNENVASVRGGTVGSNDISISQKHLLGAGGGGFSTFSKRRAGSHKRDQSLSEKVSIALSKKQELKSRNQSIAKGIIGTQSTVEQDKKTIKNSGLENIRKNLLMIEKQKDSFTDAVQMNLSQKRKQEKDSKLLGDNDAGYLISQDIQQHQQLEKQIINEENKIQQRMDFLDHQLLDDQVKGQYLEELEQQKLILSEIRLQIVEEIRRKIQNSLSNTIQDNLLNGDKRNEVNSTTSVLGDTQKHQQRSSINTGTVKSLQARLNAVNTPLTHGAINAIIKDEEIEFYGDPQMVGLVQFNVDMSHIALNIFETFTLFDLVNKSNMKVFENLQHIEGQNQIIEQRQDHLDLKMTEIEQQLLMIRQLKSHRSQPSASVLELIDQEMKY